MKRAVFSILFHWRARKRKQASSATKKRDFREMSRGLGRSMDPLDMEHCQPLPDHPHVRPRWLLKENLSKEALWVISIAIEF